jgi:hypothetical protein
LNNEWAARVYWLMTSTVDLIQRGFDEGGFLEFMRPVALTILLALAQYARTQVSVDEPHTQPTVLEQGFRDNRSDLRVDNGKFTGTAAPILEDAIARAQYVLIGEDHITREIPEFTAAVCNVMAPLGLSAMVFETSPEVAEFVSLSFGKPDRLARMAALTRRYPYSVAFMNIRQENDLAAHCAQVSNRSDFHLWGLDQDFIGSAGWVLDQIVATHPGGAAMAALTRLRGEEQAAAARAKETGDSRELFMFTAPESELSKLGVVLQRDGNPKAQALFRELIESREIYLMNMQASYESNNQRARLLKRNFRQDLDRATADGGPQRVLVKFGDWHLYKGYNPLHQRDLGNYIAEIADGQGGTSLHICILGAKGTRRVSEGYGRPTNLKKFVTDEDDSYRWLKPAIDGQGSGSWTLYDLRRLRFQKLGPVDADMERLIYGYDLLIIIPESTPADPVE